MSRSPKVMSGLLLEHRRSQGTSHPNARDNMAINIKHPNLRQWPSDLPGQLSVRHNIW